MGTAKTVLHIGVPKTGTTAVQAALTDLLARPGGAGDTITMPGSSTQQARAALSILGHGLGWRPTEAVASPEHWPRLVQQARAATGTVVVSSEFLCEAEPPVIRRIAGDLGPDRLRVVVTLRPLSQILPSAWQQYLKSGHRRPYEDWLKAVLSDPPQPSVTPSFWRRHDHAAVIDRWAGEVGADHVSVVVIDGADPGMLLRIFDDLLGLPRGSLAECRADHRNRSMTAAEAELFRRVNVVLRRTDVTWSEYAHLMRYGAILRAVKRCTPPSDAARLVTPEWALRRAAQLGAGHRAAIDALRPAGLHVIGNLDQLAEMAPAPAVDAAPPGPPEVVPMEVAVEALLGALSRVTAGTLYFPHEPGDRRDGQPGFEAPDPRRLPGGRLTSRQLADLLTGRLRKRLDRELAGRPHLSQIFGRLSRRLPGRRRVG